MYMCTSDLQIWKRGIIEIIYYFPVYLIGAFIFSSVGLIGYNLIFEKLEEKYEDKENIPTFIKILYFVIFYFVMLAVCYLLCSEFGK